METFAIGDIVEDERGALAMVTGVTHTLSVKWDESGGIFGTWPAKDFTKIGIDRAFDLGQFVRVIETSEVGIIFEDNGDPEHDAPYFVGIFDDDESEEVFSASELIPWIPDTGDRVVESDSDDDEVGTVISCDGFSSAVLWDSFPHAQLWNVGHLEPADESDDYDTWEIGESIYYASPMVAGPLEATIIGFDDVGLRVRFARDFFPEGVYSESLFTKAA